MQSEHWRLLYVAMTRARDRLIVCGAQYGASKAGEADESWRAAVEQGLRSLGAAPCETPFGEGLRYGASIYRRARERAPRSPAAPLPAWLDAPLAAPAPRTPAAPSRFAHIDPALFSPRGSRAERDSAAAASSTVCWSACRRSTRRAAPRRRTRGSPGKARAPRSARASPREALAVIEDARLRRSVRPP